MGKCELRFQPEIPNISLIELLCIGCLMKIM